MTYLCIFLQFVFLVGICQNHSDILTSTTSHINQSCFDKDLKKIQQCTPLCYLMHFVRRWWNMSTVMGRVHDQYLNFTRRYRIIYEKTTSKNRRFLLLKADFWDITHKFSSPLSQLTDLRGHIRPYDNVLMWLTSWWHKEG